MPVYQNARIGEVLGMLVRRTRVQDTSYLVDAENWIIEGMGILKTKQQLANRWADINIEFHKGALPSDLKIGKAVEWNGHRLRQGNSSMTLDTPNDGRNHRNINGGHFDGTTNAFEFIPQWYDAPAQQNPEENSIIYTYTLQSLDADQCGKMKCADNEWYEIEPGYILTSFHNGRVRVHYKGYALDDDGMPFIPDNADYKEALYYYCRAMMIGAGFQDKIFSYDTIMMEKNSQGKEGYFWSHGKRAISQIKYPSVNEMEFKWNQAERLIKDENYFQRFFSTPHKEQHYGYWDYDANISPPGGKTFLNNPHS